MVKTWWDRRTWVQFSTWYRGDRWIHTYLCSLLRKRRRGVRRVTCVKRLLWQRPFEPLPHPPPPHPTPRPPGARCLLFRFIRLYPTTFFFTCLFAPAATYFSRSAPLRAPGLMPCCTHLRWTATVDRRQPIFWDGTRVDAMPSVPTGSILHRHIALITC